MDAHLRKIIAQAAKRGPDMRKARPSADYKPPALGLARARLVGYFEMGKHDEEFEGKPKVVNKVDLVFELSGPNHEPRKLDDGTLIPIRITVQEALSLEGDSHFFKLFAAMNYTGKATHMAELLGDPFIVEVFHRKSEDGKKTFANLRGPGGYNVKGTTVENSVTGKLVLVDVPPAITELRAFIWDFADKCMWDSIYIPGEYEERKDDKGVVTHPARSKNVIQERIKTAKNWPEHPLAAVVAEQGIAPDKEYLEACSRKLATDTRANLDALKLVMSEALKTAKLRQARRRPARKAQVRKPPTQD